MRTYYSAEERAAYNAKKQEEAAARIQTLAESWETDPQKIAEYLQFSQQFHQYSTNNMMLMYAQNPNATYVGSFSRFKELGYAVQKGEHGMSILAPNVREYYRTSPTGAWRPLNQDTPAEDRRMAQSGAYEVQQRVLGYRTATVFDITQTNCPREDYPKLLGLAYNSEQHAAIYQAACETCAQRGLPVTETTMPLTRRGQCGADGICINQALGDTQKLDTLFHELGHGVLGHVGNAELTPTRKEFEADAFSILMSYRYGVDVTDARRDHLAAHYKAYCEEIRNAGGKVDITAIMQPVNRQYEILEDRLEKRLDVVIDRSAAPQREEVLLDQDMTVGMGQQPAENKVYRLYQLRPGEENAEYLFMGKDVLNALGHELDPTRYDLVYEAPYRGETLDQLFEQFNVRHPADYKGRSMSVSDVVVLPNKDGSLSAHFCDTVGFTDVPEFLEVKRDLTPEQRREYLLEQWSKETDLEPETLKWRETLTSEEQNMVEHWNGLHSSWKDQIRRGFENGELDWEKLRQIQEEFANGTAPEQTNVSTPDHPRLFVDMDGTLAQFHAEDNYLERMWESGFFENLAPYENAVQGLQNYMQQHPDTEVFILSSAIQGEPPSCAAQKHAWLDRYLPQIDAAHRLFPPVGEDKTAYIPGGVQPTDTLLDDYNVNLQQWRDAGGHSVKFVNHINDRGLVGERWDGDRVWYDRPPAQVAADLAVGMGQQSPEKTPEFDAEQTKQIQTGREHGLTPEQVAVYANPKFDSDQMDEIRLGFEEGLSAEQIAVYADPKFNGWQMCQIRGGFEIGLTAEQVAVYADPRFDGNQMSQLLQGFEHGLSAEQITLLATPNLDWKQMEQIRWDFENGLSEEQKSSAIQENVPETSQVAEMSKLDANQAVQIQAGVAHGLSAEQIMIYANSKFGWEQMRGIRLALEHGLTAEQVAVLADPKFDWQQMREIQNGFEKGLSIEQVSVYADPKFDWKQMTQMRSSFEKGLTEEQVATFANPEFNWKQMWQVRSGFLTEEQTRNDVHVFSNLQKLMQQKAVDAMKAAVPGIEPKLASACGDYAVAKSMLDMGIVPDPQLKEPIKKLAATISLQELQLAVTRSCNCADYLTATYQNLLAPEQDMTPTDMSPTSPAPDMPPIEPGM